MRDVPCLHGFSSARTIDLTALYNPLLWSQCQLSSVSFSAVYFYMRFLTLPCHSCFAAPASKSQIKVHRPAEGGPEKWSVSSPRALCCLFKCEPWNGIWCEIHKWKVYLFPKKYRNGCVMHNRPLVGYVLLDETFLVLNVWYTEYWMEIGKSRNSTGYRSKSLNLHIAGEVALLTMIVLFFRWDENFFFNFLFKNSFEKSSKHLHPVEHIFIRVCFFHSVNRAVFTMNILQQQQGSPPRSRSPKICSYHLIIVHVLLSLCSL